MAGIFPGGQICNPYLPLDEYIADAEPHVFGDRVYVFGSHDAENGATFCMRDYVVWSAPVDDLTDWTSTGTVYRAAQDPLYAPDSEDHRIYMYAPDVVQGNDGRFYLYYCMSGLSGRGGYSNPISVAVADRPDGKYEYLGFVRDRDGKPLMKYVCFDPAVINDAGIIRLYYGTYYEGLDMLPGDIGRRIERRLFCGEKKDGDVPAMGPVHVVLEDDMLTAAGEPVLISRDRFRKSGHSFFEASSIRKICFSAEGEALEATRIGGDFGPGKTLYYFIYSSRKNHELCYAVSPYPDRDFKYGGVIISNGDIGYNGRRAAKRLNHTGNNHGSIESINGQWYVFYHRQTNQSNYMRQGCAEPVTINPDGSIDQVEVTTGGLNLDPLDGGSEHPVTYPAAVCCNLTNGHMRHSANKQDPYPAPKITNRFRTESFEEEKKKLEAVGTRPVYGDVTQYPDNNVSGGELTGLYGGGVTERFVGNITRGTIIGYKYFFFEKGTATVTVRVRGKCEGSLYVCTTSDGMSQGAIEVRQSTDWKRYSVSWEQEAGVAPLYLCFDGTGEMEMLDFTLG